MNCLDITKHLSNIKDQITRFDDLVGARKPTEAISIKSEINNIFNIELTEYTDNFYRYPDQEHYDKLVQKLIDKQSMGKPFTKKELIFIYKINYPLENSGGLAEDNRIKNVRDKLNHKENAPIVFGCKSEEIIWNETGETIDIPSTVKAYVGPLFPDIFTKLRDIEYIYTSFPENRIRRSELTIGGKTEQELEEELEKNGHKISNDARRMMRSPSFTTLTKSEALNLIRLKVSDLGFARGATTQQIYDKAREYGLALCSPKVGPCQRLQDTDQPMGQGYMIAMEQIDYSTFYLERRENGLWLKVRMLLNPSTEWAFNLEFMFCLPPNAK